MENINNFIKEYHQLIYKDEYISKKALILTVNRAGETFIPNGKTVLCAGDELLIGTTYSQNDEKISLIETYIDKKHEWLDKKIREIDLPKTHLIALVKRGEKYFVPNGNTKIELNDTIIFYNV